MSLYPINADPRLPRSRTGTALVCGAALLALGIGVAAPALADQPAPANSESTMSRPYGSIVIEQPVADATVFNNNGDVEVVIALSPALRVGDSIALTLDGRAAAKTGGLRISLSAIARGDHTLEAAVVDGEGTMLISSVPVTFHMWQASRLFPNRRKN